MTIAKPRLPSSDARLFGRPLTLASGLTIPNRLAKAATSEALATIDQQPSEALVRPYRTLADGGAGLLVTGNVMIDERFVERPANVVVDRARVDARARGVLSGVRA